MKTKSRVLVTTKILAVALSTTTGCAPTTGLPGASSGPEHAEVAVLVPVVQSSEPPAPQVAAQAGAPASADANPSQAGEAPVAPEAAPQARRSPHQNPALRALRDELADESRDSAMARVAHYRPLCDKDGYPLVGNLARKTPTYGPREFCAAVRERVAAR